ncbi:co-chaperone YbbN [Gallibacterium sp. AGMB14963]|uniref:co-chaperone YbbN n=1 Tax=Gallibacterium faecale TaxID=3019086 RepID=UPI0022F18769|nr:co-chaperone YbbN [Gallibacterium sp. AGMB14963]MDA3979195.1 co-chaperone YbbN [Gallibacterium sp. AGMB14963]
MQQIIEVNTQNLAEVLDMGKTQPLVFVFYAATDNASNGFVSTLERLTTQYPNQFILAKVNCETEQMIAAQFRIQALPTTYLFKDGAPIDGFHGVLPEPELQQRLAVILPKEDEIKFNQALDYLAVENYEQALPLLKEAWEVSDKKNSDVALLYAETYIAMKKIEPAQEILKQIPLQDRDSRWQGLQAQIELLIQAADTPEIQQLQQDYQRQPTPEIAIKLAVQLHQANRNEEALELLLAILRKDLGAEDGEVKRQYLAILAAMGNSDPLTNKYRRLVYSLLY